MRVNQFVVLFICNLLVANGALASLKQSTSTCEALLLPDLFELGPAPHFTYQGATPAGIKAIDQLADQLQHNERAYNTLIEGQESIFIVHNLTASMAQNHLVLGGPGAAKTYGINVLYGSNLWSAQVNEWTTAEQIFGGQTEEGLRNGVTDINLRKSALNASFVLLDEINNANPATLGAILSFLNPGERSIDVGGEKIFGQTRAVYSTGNASRVELLNMFAERQMQSGAAMLNRYAFKTYLHNWRSPEQQLRLDAVYQQRERLKLIAMYGSEQQRQEAKALLAKTEIYALDFAKIEAIATLAFTTSDSLEGAAREFVNKMRLRMNEESYKSKREAALDKDKLPFEPSTEWTERIRAQFIRLVKHSATLDLLRLPAPIRAKLLKKPIILSPLSLWRTYAMAITNSEGIVFFDFPKLEVKFNVVKAVNSQNSIQLKQNDLERTVSEARDPREAQQIEDLIKEQTIINEILQDMLRTHIANNKEVAAVVNLLGQGGTEFEQAEFESVVYGHLWRALAKTLPQR